ncbi:MAG: ATP-binding protein [Hyphomonadaceae bacterium]|nr:ATP-binding protein [Hyphomonadaceae bacterium]
MTQALPLAATHWIRWIRPAGIAAAGAGAIVLLAEGVAGHGAAAAALLIGVAGGAFAVWRMGLARPASPPQAPAPEAASGEARASLTDLTPFIEALPEAALLIEQDGRIAASNAEARRQLKFEAQGLRLSSILRHPEILDAAQAAAVDGVSRVVEYENAAPVEEHFRVYAAPIAWGEDAAALLVFHDQTTQIMTERMRADFLANASHELKTPVTSLSLLIETVSGPARADEGARDRFITMMGVQVDRMKRLVDDLLSLSKIELNEHVPPADRADLTTVVSEAMDAIAPIARERRVTIRVAADAGGQVVVGDRFQLVQVAQNLIDNAVKYSPDGGEVTVEIGAAEGRDAAAELAGRRWPDAARIALLTPPITAGRSYAFLRVADAGQGIPKRHLPRLSERFFRVERDQGGAEKTGTGLGLAIVKHIVNRHRGGFVVESVPGRGSAFAVYIERARVADG